MDSAADPVRILIVEDTHDQKLEHLFGGDYAVHRTSRLEDAVEELQQRPGFGCVLLDPLLPGTDPLEALEAISSLAPDAPIVVLTRNGNGLSLDLRKAGVRDFLPKEEVGSETLHRVVLHAMERKRERLAHEALHDPLTGLPNRTLFRDRCLQALAGIGRASVGVGVLFVDLDGFKRINDSLGHGVGDRLIQLTADRIRECVRAGDTVSRFGGDEFTVLGPSIDTRRGAITLAERILAMLAAPFHIAEFDVTVGCSIGIALTTDGEADPDELIHDADIAMYHAKERGGSRYEFFGRFLRTRTARRRELDAELSTALQEGQLRVAYQPQVELASGRMVGLEALVRWQHPRRGIVTAGKFIRVAEETGMIPALGRSVLKYACRDYAAWLENGGLDPDVRLTINLSPRQLARGDVVDDIAAALADTGIQSSNLCFDITEAAVVADVARAGSVLQRLKALGVRIAMDDFGVGYASLGYLERFPIDTLKIDRSLIYGVAEDGRRQRVVATVIALAETLELDVVAEGIELPEDAEKLIALGCRYGQGYLYARAVEGPVLLPQNHFD